MKHLLLLLLLLSSCISEQKTEELVSKSKGESYINENSITFDQNYKPYTYLANGKLHGLYPLLVKLIFDQTDFKPHLVGLPWRRCMKLGQNAMAGVAGAYKNSERIKVFDYSDAIWEERLLYYNLKEDSFNFTDIQSLKGKHVGLMDGWSYGEDLDKVIKNGLFQAHIIDGHDQIFRMISMKRLDGTIIDEVSARIILKRNQLEGKFKGSKNPVAVNSAYLIFNKKQNRKELVDKFNKAMRKLKASGEFNRAVESFYKGN